MDAADAIARLAATDGRRARFSVRPAGAVELPVQRELLAGAAEVDITPPPGLPRAGYSRNAHTGTGFRTRLRARVLHLRAGTSSIALVATDLLGGSAVVQHLAALRVAERTDVRLAGLFLGATHTHGAPGQFHGTPFYNRFSSNKPGFDPAWTAFLADRIAGAVELAVERRRPAALAWGRTEIRGLTRNRSLPAHLRNPDADPGTGVEDAVNPWLELLRVDARAADGGTEPLAAFAVFSIHGTCVPMSSRSYNADVWAYLCDALGDGVEASHGTRPVVGALQGTHGDVTPALRGRAGHSEAARIGAGIGTASAELYGTLDGHLDQKPLLAQGFREVDLRTPARSGGVVLPRRPAVGAALIAGAKENETPVIGRIPPFRAQTPKPFGGRGPQGAKWVVGSRWGQPLVLPLAGFPRIFPVHVLRIGEVLLTGLPMEITTESGRRIARAAEAGWSGAGGDRVRAVVSSVADEYAGYCTTREEYGAQFYEGGHTLYGPGTQRFFAGCAEELAAAVARAGTVQEPLPERSFDLPVRRYLPAPTGRHVEPRSAGDPRVVDGPEPHVEWSWTGPAPGDLTWHAPIVRVEARTAADWATVLDDARGALEVVHLAPAPDHTHHYATRWYTPHPETPHRFSLTPKIHSPIM